jgi:hypothetical protein
MHTFSLDEMALMLLLGIGLYFPTSLAGERSGIFTLISFAIMLGLLSYLAWRHGTRPGAVTFISLPITIVMTACTFSVSGFRFGWGVFAAFTLLALVLALDLRTVRPGRFTRAAFVIANLLNIACGIAIIAGNEWISQFLSAFYSSFYPELVPAMLGLHKPILTFGTHSLAGLFLYLFFWLNWETYKSRRSSLALFFAVSELILLLAVASFTSFAFATLALLQIGTWLWNRNRMIFATATACVVLIASVGVRWFEDNQENSQVLPQLAGTLLDSDSSGPLARYGSGGDLRQTIKYLFDHPLSPIGFATPSYIYIVDSGPLEYMLRGSIPLLVLIYWGLYRFLRHNLESRTHAVTLFLIIIGFETGFTALSYFRTAYLLTFFVVYLKQLVPDFDHEGRSATTPRTLQPQY